MILIRRLLPRSSPLAAVALAFLGCSDNAANPSEKVILNREDLDRASLKIVAGETDRALAILENLNRNFPSHLRACE